MLGFIRCPPSLLSSLVEVAAGAHEAANHCRNDGHEQQNGRSDASQSGGTELVEHASLLLALRDHLEGVEAAVAAVAVPAAEGDERAVEAVVPRAVLVHVPQAVLIRTHRGTAQKDGQQQQRRRHQGRGARRKPHPEARHDANKPGEFDEKMVAAGEARDALGA